MGKQMEKAYDIAEKAGGLQYQMRLALKVGMTRKKAADQPDDPALLQKLEKALKEITGKDIPPL